MDRAVHRELGLTDDELTAIISILGRQPNLLELAMYGVMWSEHCSYKSSRLHLRRLPSEGPGVLVGPGENAGVVDVGDSLAVALRIESHNHPSAIEPYQGAATGVGGIIRDIFTMGARPIAIIDPLRFGPIDDPRSRFIAEGVVAGVSGYGNSVGVPTVAGEVCFDRTYRSNPLVNVGCVGLVRHDRIALGRASGQGNLAVLMGSRTGRDGIGGVSVLASAGFDHEAAAKRPSVQVGDPFEEKRLIEACLELLASGLVVGLQDLGGAGLSCATSETAARAGLGMDVYLDQVPLREDGMEPFEIMTSESQERMLAIVEPARLADLERVCARHEIRCSVVGIVTGPKGRLRVLGPADASGARPVLADVPAASLADQAPLYDRPAHPRTGDRGPAPEGAELGDLGGHLLSMLTDTAPVWGQYDHQLFLNTVAGPGGDATVLRLRAAGVGASAKGLALSSDGNHRWCASDPRIGTRWVVAESTLNLACVGALPLAMVNCLNFGNPEHPEVMWQLSQAVDGLAEAAKALSVPVVGGNVSLYNESDGEDIDPTPVVLTVGLVEPLDRPPPGLAPGPNQTLLLVGPRSDCLVGSALAVDRLGRPGGSLPEIDLTLHLGVLHLLVELVRGHKVEAIHDVSDGGLAVTLAEMARAGRVGVRVDGLLSPAELFAETPSRVVVATTSPQDLETMAAAAGVPTFVLGSTDTSEVISVPGLLEVTVGEIDTAARGAMAGLFGVPARPDIAAAG